MFSEIVLSAKQILFLGAGDLSHLFFDKFCKGDFLSPKYISQKKWRVIDFDSFYPTRISFDLPRFIPFFGDLILVDLSDETIFKKDETIEDTVKRIKELFGAINHKLLILTYQNDIDTSGGFVFDIEIDSNGFACIVFENLANFESDTIDYSKSRMSSIDLVLDNDENLVNTHDQVARMIIQQVYIEWDTNKSKTKTCVHPTQEHSLLHCLNDRLKEVRLQFWEIVFESCANNLPNLDDALSILNLTHRLLFNQTNVDRFLNQVETFSDQSMIKSMFLILDCFHNERVHKNTIFDNKIVIRRGVSYDKFIHHNPWSVNQNNVILDEITRLVYWILTEDHLCPHLSICTVLSQHIEKVELGESNYNDDIHTHYFKVRIHKNGKVSLVWRNDDERVDFVLLCKQVIDIYYPEYDHL